MHTCDPAGVDSVRISIAGVDATIRAPRDVVAVLDQMLVPAPPSSKTGGPSTTIDVARDEFAWRISGSSQRSAKVLSATSALPQVGGAVVSSLMSDVAEATQ